MGLAPAINAESKGDKRGPVLRTWVRHGLLRYFLEKPNQDSQNRIRRQPVSGLAETGDSGSGEKWAPSPDRSAVREAFLVCGIENQVSSIEFVARAGPSLRTRHNPAGGKTGPSFLAKLHLEHADNRWENYAS